MLLCVARCKRSWREDEQRKRPREGRKSIPHPAATSDRASDLLHLSICRTSESESRARGRGEKRIESRRATTVVGHRGGLCLAVISLGRGAAVKKGARIDRERRRIRNGRAWGGAAIPAQGCAPGVHRPRRYFRPLFASD